MNRKEFLKNSGRWAILTGFGIMAAFFAAKNKITIEPETCTTGSCSRCSKFVNCELPLAKIQQENGKQG